MLSYDTQLDLKRNVIVKAYANFSGASLFSVIPLYLINVLFLLDTLDISADALPPILPTHGSPLQYDYRTKITPHFEAPPKRFLKPDAERPPEGEQPSWLKIGFNQVGTRHAMDIEVGPASKIIVKPS
jgi:tRNA (uracil-5-)-methyltransferase